MFVTSAKEVAIITMSRCTEEHTFVVLKQDEAGAAVADLGRKNAISGGTFYKWRA